jgi:hypothetical protein
MPSSIVDQSSFNKTVANDMAYIREMCIQFCQDPFRAKCQDYLDNTFLCTLNGTTVDMRAECDAQCPLECSSTIYSHTITYYQYSSNEHYFDQYANRTSEIETSGRLLDDLVEVRITYESGMFTFYENEPKMSGEDLLASIGGHLHVFLGMSMLSVIELLELGVIALLRCLRRDGRSQKYQIKTLGKK